MNAYGLADKLQMDKAKALLYVDTVVLSAEMLRQQADRIAELEKKTKPLSDEEIEEAIKTSTVKLSELEAYDYCYPQKYRLDEKMFARAIEERHGIK